MIDEAPRFKMPQKKHVPNCKACNGMTIILFVPSGAADVCCLCPTCGSITEPWGSVHMALVAWRDGNTRKEGRNLTGDSFRTFVEFGISHGVYG